MLKHNNVPRIAPYPAIRLRLMRLKKSLVYLEDTVQLACAIAENLQLIVTQNTIINLIILCHKPFGLPVTEIV